VRASAPFLSLTKLFEIIIENNMRHEITRPECSHCSVHGFCFDKFESVLRNNQGRLTKERLVLLETVCNMKGHFHADHLLKLLKDLGYNHSLVTIYRNLALLIEAGIIRRAVVQEDTRSGGAWYEHIWGREHHDHLVCSRCGRKVEFSYPAIEVLQEAVASEHGFTLERHHLELVGICPECRGKGAAR
jgi:Fur family transcriptional regulator, ferric uptake regulator